MPQNARDFRSLNFVVPALRQTEILERPPVKGFRLRFSLSTRFCPSERPLSYNPLLPRLQFPLNSAINRIVQQLSHRPLRLEGGAVALPLFLTIPVIPLQKESPRGSRLMSKF